MANPFEPRMHSNPYILNPFTIAEIRPDQWRPTAVEADLDYARQRARGVNPRQVGGVVITEQLVNSVDGVFQDPNLRPDYALVVHTHHSAPKGALKDLGDRVDALRPVIPIPARSLSLQPELLSNLTMEPTSGTIPELRMPPFSPNKRTGPRPKEVPLTYLEEELLS